MQEQVLPIVTPQVPHQILPFVLTVPESVFMPPCPQFPQANWDAMSNHEEFPKLVGHDTWKADEELFVRLKFPTKDAMWLALKHYSIKRHQNYRVEDSDARRITAKCPQFSSSYNWRVRAIQSKRSN